MNTAELSADRIIPPTLGTGFSLWLSQALAIFRIEFGKAIFSKRSIGIYVLSSGPIIIFLIAWYASIEEGEPAFETIEEARRIFGYMYSMLILGTVVFLGCAYIFTNLFRGEVLDRSIHYYMLTPVRREVLVAGKFLAGYSCALLLFGGCTLISFFLMYMQFGMDRFITDLTTGIAVQQMGQYIGITLLAVLGYGSVFVAAGLLFRNPLIPVIIIAAWETIHFILPPALKVFAIIHYLKGLLPIPMDEGPLAVIVAPPPVWVSIVGMILLSGIMLTIAGWLLKRLEVKYTDE